MIKKSTRRGNWIVSLPLASLGLAYLYFFFLPAKTEIDQLQDELARMQDAVARAQPMKLAIYETEQELEASAKYVEQWKQQNPPDAATLLADISSEVRKAGVHTVQFDPQPTERLNTVTKNNLTLGTQGSFQQMMIMLKNLENLNPTVWVNQFRVEAPAREGDPLISEVNLAIFAVNPDNSD